MTEKFSRWPFRAGLLLTALVTICFAQNESLLIGPGDRLHIQVFDTPEMEQGPRVTDAGMVPLMFIGDIKVSGMTPREAGHEIEEALKAQHLMLNPQVAVTVQQYATQDAYVMGQVTNPGMYPIATPLSVVDVLALAGGLTDLADRHISVERHGDPSRRLSYFLSNQPGVALENAVLVYPGDTVLVPKVGVVYVLGDVNHAGGFPIAANDSQMTVLQSLAMAGSATKTARLSKAKLIRRTPAGPQEIPIVLEAMQKGREPDIQMQADDILFVPSSLLKTVTQNTSQIVAAAGAAAIYAAGH